MIQRREKKREQLEDKFASTINNEIIEDMWNTEIFPFWDRHWDYKRRKPKEKGYIARGIEAICSCWSDSKKNDGLSEKSTNSGLNIKTNILESLWKHGLPPASRKTLWPLIIGNNLAINPMIVEDIRKRKKNIAEYENIGMEKEIVEMG